MENESLGLTIARQRIDEEADSKTGKLDLGGLGLAELPAELFGLSHLRELNLGRARILVGDEWQYRPWEPDPEQSQVNDRLDRLSHLHELRILFLDSTNLADLTPLTGLSDLQSLDCSGTRVADLALLTGLSSLQSLNCGITQVVDLTPLTGLSSLQTLDCWSTQVADLTPLTGLSNLQSLNCSETQVADLTALTGLSSLQSLDCAWTRVAELTPLSGLSSLQSLNCRSTQVVDLTPLSGLSSLQTLDCSRTQVVDLTSLSGLSGLQSLYCSFTQVADLAPLTGLSSLQSLDCSGTRVADLAPLAGLSSLQSLDCSGTQVADLTPLSGLSGLQWLNLSYISLTTIPEGFWWTPSLAEVVLHKTALPDLPPEVLSKQYFSDCLADIRAHLTDLEAGCTSVTDVKLLVLGNGRVGKTQLRRRLQGKPFQSHWDSTHGIQIASASIGESAESDAASLQIWDFGGQDIYHGTHALFLRTRSVFALLWSKDPKTGLEYEKDEYEHQGIRFRNHPLLYWVEYVRHVGDDGPILIVQTKCDKPADEARRFPVTAKSLDALPPYVKQLHYSAANPERGRAALDEALRDAVVWLRGLDGKGVALIGVGRMRVQRHLEALRDADAALSVAQRRHRSISQDDFQQICEAAGGVSSPEHLLTYLNNAGVVIYRKGLFQDRIILDQAWALDSIYALFDRDRCYRQLQHMRGRFTRPLLDALVWREQNHTADDQRLFLSMMQSCGICFMHRQETEPGSDDAEYVAPDLLPEKDAPAIQAQLREKWDTDHPVIEITFEYPFLHAGLVRGVIARIGSAAGENALYWRGGVCVYEATTDSKALIEQETGDNWSGKIRLRTQRGQAALLLEQLAREVEKEQARLGLTPSHVARPVVGALNVTLESSTLHGRAVAGKAEKAAASKFNFKPTRPATDRWYVSYAWKDNTPEGQDREAVVDAICEEGLTRGIDIKRDKDRLGLGDDIRDFMRDIGQGDRVFVVLSDKYLKSPYCMFELHELWRTSKNESKRFRERVRMFAAPDAKIWELEDRLRHGRYWKTRHDRLRAALDPETAGLTTYEEYRRIQDFYQNTTEILSTLVGVVQPRTLEAFKLYGFRDPPSPSEPRV